VYTNRTSMSTRHLRTAILLASAPLWRLCGQDQPVVPAVRCAADQRAETIVLSLVPKDVAVPRNPGQHWAVEPMPAGADLQVSDAALRTAIENWTKLDTTKKHPWVLDGRNEWTFFNSGLVPGLAADFRVNPFPLVRAPAAGATPVRKPVTFCVAPVKDLSFDALEIQIVSAGVDLDKPMSAGRAIEAGLPPQVTAVAFLAPGEDARGAAILNAYAAVGRTAWEAARKNGIAVGASPKEATLRAAEAAVTDVYNMARGGIPFQFWGAWPQPRAVFHHTAAGACCTLLITGVRMSDGAVIKVEPKLPSAAAETSAEDPAPIPEDDQPLPASGKARRAAALARQSQAALRRRFDAALRSFTNAVPTFAQIDSLRSDLAAAREIYPTVRMGLGKGNPHVIVFDTDNRWTILAVNLAFGAGYSPEEKFAGKADFEGENLIFQVPDKLDPVETETLNYTGGNEVQKLNSSWGLTWTHNYAGGSQAIFGPRVSGSYLQDLNQRFGNLTGPELRDRERGVEPAFGYTFGSSPFDSAGEAARHVLGTDTSAGFRYRHVNIDPESGSVAPPLATGTLLGVFIDAMESYRFQPVTSARGGLGGIDVRVEGHVLRGFPAGDFGFTQVLGSVQGTVYFGFADPRDYFVRYRKTLGTSNGDTPLYELFRLGGGDSVRGIEQGEYVGRKLAAEQYESGIAARRIVSWFRKPADPAKKETAPTRSPIDLSKIYVKGFYDRGRVTERGSFSDLFAFSHGAKGYGGAVELQGLSAGNKRITLTVGYAKSPDSVLHRSGVVVTAASIDF
jgi:hypothetical protein